MKQLIILASIPAACGDNLEQPEVQKQGTAWACHTIATCNEPHAYEPATQYNTHRLCAASTGWDVVIPGDGAALDWERIWLAGCEANAGRELEYSGVDESELEPLACASTSLCRASCEPLFIPCDL